MTPKVVLLQHAPALSTRVEHVAQGQEDSMNGSQGREEWARLITKAKLLTAMTREELFAEATSVYDNYVEALETPRSPRPLLISG
jgi:rsbT co-antagonist protein RsbR